MAKPLKSDPTAPISRLADLIATLRGENGCPWDKKQTPETIAHYIVEEAYELVDAIIGGDTDAIREETGDVLFQIFFVIQLFSEYGRFDLSDVVESNLEKMIRRHPHVFGKGSADSAEMVAENWEKIKRKEKSEGGPSSILSSIPQSLPALLRAATVSRRAAKTGFDWTTLSDVMEKTMEEWREFSREVDCPESMIDHNKAADEFGDLLFTLVNVARFAHIHPETALLRSIQKFERRFRYMEEKALARSERFEELSFQAMHGLWDEAKDVVG